MRFRSIFELFKETFAEWQEDKAARLAAALAYYTVFSLAPLVIITLGLAGLIFGQDTVGSYLIEQGQSLVGQEGAQIIQSIIENSSQPAANVAATLIGIATLLFGASGVFGQLQDALNTVWGVVPKPGQDIWGIIKSRFLSLTMVLGIGFLLLVSLILSVILSIIQNFLGAMFSEFSLILLQIANLIISFGLITLLFAMIYKILPDVEIEWHDVWMGAAMTALLFSIGKFLLGYYLGSQSFGSTYGAAGSILIILLWVYYSAQILLFGAEFTQVYAKRYGSKIVPDEDAILITPAIRAKQGIPQAEEVEMIQRMQEQQRQRGQAAEVRSKQGYHLRPISVAAHPPRDRFVTIWVTLFLAVLFIRGIFSSSSKPQR